MTLPSVDGPPPAQMSRIECFWHEEDKVWQFRGSSFGNCLHGSVMCLRKVQPHKPDMFMQSRFSAGSTSEERIKKILTECGEGAELEDAGIHWSEGQRRVDVCGDVKDETYRITCSLDGWMINVRTFIEATVGKVYDPAVSTQYMPESGPAVFEHKSVTMAKWEEMFGPNGWTDNIGVIDPVKVRQWMKTYAWQVSAQAWGLAADLEKLEVEIDQDYPLPILVSVEAVERDPVTEMYVPRHRGLAYIHHPPYSRQECLERCAEAVRLSRTSETPKCDSEWQCLYLAPPTRPDASGPPERLEPVKANGEVFDLIARELNGER
jgi:hypothetical protein